VVALLLARTTSATDKSVLIAALQAGHYDARVQISTVR
jgi:hypothetical protein